MSNYYKINHVRVIDADTYDVNLSLGFGLEVGQRVVLSGLDAPEVYGVNASVDGQKAKEFAQNWITEKLKLEGTLYYVPNDLELPNEGYIIWYGADLVTEKLNDVLVQWGHATSFPKEK